LNHSGSVVWSRRPARQSLRHVPGQPDEHAAACDRLGSVAGSAQHAGCVRELDALKILHDKWSAEEYASLI
jgi:hypothetical protein